MSSSPAGRVLGLLKHFKGFIDGVAKMCRRGQAASQASARDKFDIDGPSGAWREDARSQLNL
jgi:hypothetical protein